MHLDSKEPVARVCDYLSTSQSSLYRMFHAEVGQSPLACFHLLKMEKAKQQLLETDLLVKEIAFSLGYHQLSDFSHAFKEKFGISPTMMRESQPGKPEPEA